MPRRWPPSSTACGSCCGSRSPTARAEFAVLGAMASSALDAAAPAQRRTASRSTGRDPWAALAPGAHRYAPDAGHPASEWRLDRGDRAAQRRSPTRPRPCARVASPSPAPSPPRRCGSRPGVRGSRPRSTRSRIPHELDWLRTAVHLGKGCYRGQETVAKVLQPRPSAPPARAAAPRRQRHRAARARRRGRGREGPARAELEGEAPERREVGHVTLERDALRARPDRARGRRSAPCRPTSRSIVESHGIDVAAAQVEIVPADAGAAVDVPRLPRLGVRK